MRPSILYHATTHKKARLYRETGHILAPVRGFDTLIGAMAWACKVGRPVVLKLEVEPECVHKLPDHHNRFGTAWWHDGDVHAWHGEFDAGADA